jgi:hypothetical protein
MGVTYDRQVLISEARGQLVGLEENRVFVEVAFDLLVFFANHFDHFGFLLVVNEVQYNLFPFLHMSQELFLFGSLSLETG